MRVFVHFGLWGLGLRPAETQTTDAERNCLARYANGKRRLAEIGVWHGVTTCRLRKAMAGDGKLFAIDPYPAGRLGFSTRYVIAHKETSKIPNGSLIWMRDTGSEAARKLAGTEHFDFVFIDGDHSYEGLSEGWTGWRPLVGVGGVIALHDSRSTPERPIDGAGSVRFTQDVILQDPCFEAVDTVDSLTVVRRIRA